MKEEQKIKKAKYDEDKAWKKKMSIEILKFKFEKHNE